MGLVIVPHRLREPPRGPAEINRRDPLGKCLDFVFLGTNLSGKSIDGKLTGTLVTGNYVKATPRGLALADAAWYSGSSAYVTIPTQTSYPYVMIWYGWSDAIYATPAALYNTGNYTNFTHGSTTSWNFSPRHNYGIAQTLTIATGAGASSGGLSCLIGVVYSATDYRFFANGQMATGTTNCGSPPSFDRVLPPSCQNAGGFFLSGYGFGRAISDADALRITANPQLVWGALSSPPSPIIWAPATAGASGALAGDAQAMASASGALAVSVPLAGAAIGAVTAGGALSTAMPLAGAAAAVSSAGGTLSIGIALSGSALANASGTGQMQIAIALSGAAIAQAAASGSLGASGGTALSGTAAMQATATGAMSLAIPLAGAAHVVAGASGNLTAGSGAALSGAAVAVTTAAGALTVTVSLSGAAMAQAVAAGGMRLQVPLSGQAVMHASALGALSGGEAVLASDPRYTVTRHALDASVGHAAMDTLIAARSRKLTVHAH